MVHAGCVYVILNVKIFWVCAMECVYRLDLSLCSHPKEFLGEWSQNPCSLQGKNPLYQKNSPQTGDRAHDTASSRTASPTHYQWAVPTPKSQDTETRPTSASSDPIAPDVWQVIHLSTFLKSLVWLGHGLNSKTPAHNVDSLVLLHLVSLLRRVGGDRERERERQTDRQRKRRSQRKEDRDWERERGGEWSGRMWLE